MTFQTFQKNLSRVAVAVTVLLFTFSRTVAQAPPTPMHQYLMDEGTGTTTADSGSPGGVNGTLQSSTIFTTDAPFPYEGNHAIVMADSQATGSVDITGAIPTDADAWTKWSASMWAKRDGADTGWAGTLSSWSSTPGIAGDFQIRQHPTVPLQIMGRNPSGQLWDAGAGGMLWPADVWSHIAINVDHDAGMVDFWLDGNKASTAIHIGGTGLWSNTGQLIGSGNEYALLGPMDEVAIWGDRLLSDGEANHLFNSSLSTNTPIPAKMVTWNVDASGDWNNSTNWKLDGVGTVPNSANQTAIFGSIITSPQTAFTNTDVTVNRIEFSNTEHSYAISGHGSVNLFATTDPNNPVNPSISAQGTHLFQAAVNLHAPTTADVASGSVLTFDGALNLSGTTLTKTGDGTLTVNNQVTLGGGSVINALGVINGVGTIGGDVDNEGGTISPGNSQAVQSIADSDVRRQVPEPGALVLLLMGTLAWTWQSLIRSN